MYGLKVNDWIYCTLRAKSWSPWARWFSWLRDLLAKAIGCAHLLNRHLWQDCTQTIKGASTEGRKVLSKSHRRALGKSPKDFFQFLKGTRPSLRNDALNTLPAVKASRGFAIEGFAARSATIEINLSFSWSKETPALSTDVGSMVLKQVLPQK